MLAELPDCTCGHEFSTNSTMFHLQFCDYRTAYTNAYRDSEDLVEEERVVDPNTGGMKGNKLARFDYIPPDVLWELATHYGKGAAKYPDADGTPNWQRGYDWRLSVAALYRHLTQWQMGEAEDLEFEDSHLISVIWHAFALRWFELHGKGTDFRNVESKVQTKESEVQARDDVFETELGLMTTNPDKMCQDIWVDRYETIWHCSRVKDHKTMPHCSYNTTDVFLSHQWPNLDA